MDVAGDLQIDCFTVYELACRLQYVYSFYVPTLTSPRVVHPGGFQRALDRVALLPILSALVAAPCDIKESSKAVMNSCEF